MDHRAISSRVAPWRRYAVLGAVAAASLALLAAACSHSTSSPDFTAGLLAGTWKYADAQSDTLVVTLTVTDTVLSGSGFATNAQLRTLSGGTITDVPLAVTGWCSPAQRKLHLDATSPDVPLLAAQLDATVQDASHIAATWTITVNGTPFWSQTTVEVIPKS